MDSDTFDKCRLYLSDSMRRGKEMRLRNFGFAALTVVAVSSAFAADRGDSGVKVNALVDGYYQYNFNKPPVSTDLVGSSQSAYRQDSRGHRQFDLNQARVGVSKGGTAGFDLQVGMGTQLQVLNTVDSARSAAYQYIRKATVNVNHDRMSFAFGRFDTDFGYERIDSVDNMNYSRSFAHSNDRPLYLTGLLFGYDFGNGFSTKLAVANGVNRFTDNNRAPSYMAQVNYGAGETTVGLHYVGGPETGKNSADWRHNVNLNAKHNYSKTLLTGGEFMFTQGVNEFVGTDIFGNVYKTSTRFGVALYGSVSVLEDHWDSLRAEWYSDRQGYVAQTNSGTRYFTVTGTHRYKYTQNLSVWGEVRWDNANADRYRNSNGDFNKNNQFTLLAAATYSI